MGTPHAIVIPTWDLRLGAVVGQLPIADFSTCVVVRIGDEAVTLCRVYVRTSDVAVDNQVIPFTGMETFSVWKSGPSEWALYRRGGIKA